MALAPSADARLMLFICRDIDNKGFRLLFEAGFEIGVKGHLDHETKTARVDPEYEDWLYTLCHEHGHVCQQYEDTNLYREGDDYPEELELDADRRAWRNLVGFGVFSSPGAESRAYIQTARLHALRLRPGLDWQFRKALEREVENPDLIALMPISWYGQLSGNRLRAVRALALKQLRK